MTVEGSTTNLDTTCDTPTATLAVAVPDLAVIFTVPTPTAVTRPRALTAATRESLLDQAT